MPDSSQGVDSHFTNLNPQIMKQFFTKTCLALAGLFLMLKPDVFAQNYANPLMIPYLIDNDTIRLKVEVKRHNFNPFGADSLNTLVDAYAYNHVDSNNLTILGPTIKWRYQRQTHTTVKNNLSHLTTSHWHGAHVPPYADGGPHQRIMPGNTWAIDFDILDKSATMWYHPHAMDITYEQVQLGMAGMIYVEDPELDPILSFIHDIIPIDYGVDDIPLIVQTKKFFRDSMGVVRIDSGGAGSNIVGYKADYHYVINGRVDPFLEVPADMIRFRVLNGDGKFAFNLGLGDKNLNYEGIELIATDAGYTNRSYGLNSVVMGPGERTEWLADLRGREGDTLYLVHYGDRFYDVYQGFPPKSIIGDSATTDGYSKDTALMRIIVTASTQPPSPIIAFPINLHPLETPPFDANTRMRDKIFTKEFDSAQNANVFLINHRPMDMMYINDTINLGDTELWTIRNHTRHAHPFHIHDIHFWVTQIVDTANNDTLNPADYPWIFGGPLDNVMVMPGWHLTFVGVFDDFGVPFSDSMFAETYMFHCHILPHEDRGMMGQFAVWNGLSTTVEEELPAHVQIKMFPNPASEKIYIKGKSKHPSEIRIYDLSGRKLKTYQMDTFSGVGWISVADIPRGYVMVEWLSAEGRVVNKVMIK